MSLTRRSFLMACGVAATGPWAYGQAPARGYGRFATWIPDLMEHYDVPGLALACLSGGRIVWRIDEGVANIETSAPVTDETVFEAASLTKPVFAYLAMLQVQAGKLELDRPLHEYVEIPFQTEHMARARAMTARHVLTHSTGLPNWAQQGKPVRVRFEPGTRFSYSGMAFVYLQQVVETLTGTGLAEMAKETLFAPLGMESASLVWREDYEKRLAHGHNNDGKTTRGMMPQANAASTLVCSPVDYARFLIHMVGMGEDPARALDDEYFDAMVSEEIDATKGVSWCLGWGIEHTNAGNRLWHWGNNRSAYHSFFAFDADAGDGVVVMTNSGNGLRLCHDLVPAITGENHPAFDWTMVVPPR